MRPGDLSRRAADLLRATALIAVRVLDRARESPRPLNGTAKKNGKAAKIKHPRSHRTRYF
jgi:hypothetical protein